MNMSMSNFARDTFVAPHMSAFTNASIPDVSADNPHRWLSAFILNSMVRAQVAAPDRQYMFNFLRRAEAAFEEYGVARQRTLDFLAAPDSVSQYVAAIFHWEVFLSQCWQAYRLLGRFLRLGNKDLFARGDGSAIPD